MNTMEQAAIGPKSYSGKWTTAFLLVSVLVTGGLFFWVVNAYSVYNAAGDRPSVIGAESPRHWMSVIESSTPPLRPTRAVAR